VCSEECSRPEAKNDRILEYTKEVLHQGLIIMANKYVVREGYGPGMLMFWRYNMPSFFNNNHYKYVIAGHNMLASKNLFQTKILICVCFVLFSLNF